MSAYRRDDKDFFPPCFRKTALLFLGAILLGSCGKGGQTPAQAKKEAVPEAPALSSAIDPGGAPRVEQALVIPAVQKGAEGLLVVYRHSQFGYAEIYGFDTFIYRFLFLPGGWLDTVTVYERRLEGEKMKARYSFAYVGDEVIVTESSPEGAREKARVFLGPRETRLEGSQGRFVFREEQGNLFVESFGGARREKYALSGGAGTMLCSISKVGAAEAEGRYDIPEKGRVVYVEKQLKDSSGAAATTISLWRSQEGEYRFRTEGVVPLNEVYAVGLLDAFAGEKGLQNMTLVDLVLGPEQNIRPVLAYALWEAGRLKP